MTSNQNKAEADEYSSFLRERLGNTLSNALADVINERPRDPIQHLAKLLYRSRNLAPPSENEHDSSDRRERMMRWSSSQRLQYPSSGRSRHGDSSSANKFPENMPVQNRLSETSQSQKNTQCLQKQSACNLTVQPADNRPLKKRIFDDNTEDLFDDDNNSLNLEHLVHVHKECMKMFEHIGDIFDDFGVG